MADKFSIGQKVRIIRSKYPELLGTVTTIADKKKLREIMIDKDHNKAVIKSAYLIDTKSPLSGRNLAALEGSLEPVYDGNDKISWTECAWQPNKVRLLK